MTDMDDRLIAEVKAEDVYPGHLDRRTGQTRVPRTVRKAYAQGYLDGLMRGRLEGSENGFSAGVAEATKKPEDVEPKYPLPCTSCGMPYYACTKSIRAGKKACCPICADTATHAQNLWEAWDRRQKARLDEEFPSTGIVEQGNADRKRSWTDTGVEDGAGHRLYEPDEPSVVQRVENLERQVDILHRGIGVMTASITPGMKWIDQNMEKG